jgi:hypothetical protein
VKTKKPVTAEKIVAKIITKSLKETVVEPSWRNSKGQDIEIGKYISWGRNGYFRINISMPKPGKIHFFVLGDVHLSGGFDLAQPGAEKKLRKLCLALAKIASFAKEDTNPDYAKT